MAWGAPPAPVSRPESWGSPGNSTKDRCRSCRRPGFSSSEVALPVQACDGSRRWALGRDGRNRSRNYLKMKYPTTPRAANPPITATGPRPEPAMEPPPAHMSGVGSFGTSMPPWFSYSATPGTLWVGHFGQPGGPTKPSEQTVPPSWVAWQQTPAGGGCPYPSDRPDKPSSSG